MAELQTRKCTERVPHLVKGSLVCTARALRALWAPMPPALLDRLGDGCILRGLGSCRHLLDLGSSFQGPCICILCLGTRPAACC